MSLIKNQIKTPKLINDKNSISYIDDKKGNIITSDANDLILWSKYKKSYKEMKIKIQRLKMKMKPIKIFGIL